MALTIVDILIFLIVFIVALYYYGMKPYNHFKNTKIKHIKPSIPLLGTMETVLFGKEDIYSFCKRAYHLSNDK